MVGPFPLENSYNNFEKAATDEFVLTLGRSLGKVHKVDIGHDGKGPASAWHLAQVDVAEMATGETSSFVCGDWLSPTSKPVPNRMVLELGRAAADGKHLWTVTVVTSGLRGAGTDANVSICIFGKEANTGALVLDNRRAARQKEAVRVSPRLQLRNIFVPALAPIRFAASLGGLSMPPDHAARILFFLFSPHPPNRSKDNFEKGKTDVFHLKANGVGEVTHIQLGHDDSGAFAAWHVASVRVQDTTAGQDVLFPVNAWFSKSDPPCKTTQILYPSGSAQVSFKYRVTVYTSDLRGAGTNANVTIKMEGVLGGLPVAVGPFPLDTAKDNFEKGQTDEFVVEGADVGELKRITMATDGAQPGSAWHLKMVEVRFGKEKSLG